ncbi:hypothetical protein PsorP6_018116 [Peronosclerospora sorghi]|uniref:Uncharacterized protein n=1 Tax=Peronosclerospora sorghi TaxID=230839 RepID=A0ACC0WE60_9STRA|nr:hypothetical protein PsorP6_018116 [Peronosclerospora sorghi]
MGDRRDELLRLVVALSSACKKDNNVLKDGELVDALETHGRRIAQLREQQKVVVRNKPKLTMSPLREGTEMATKFTEQVLGDESLATEGTPKRRKVLVDSEVKRSIALHTVSVADEVTEAAVMVNPLSTYHMRRSMSPKMKTRRALYAASPSKHLSRADSANSVDLAASSTSTMSSYYDDMRDDYVDSESGSRYPRSPLPSTTSMESVLDWTLSDDIESMQFRSIADDGAPTFPVSSIVTRPSLGCRDNAQLQVGEQPTTSSAEEGDSPAVLSSRVASVNEMMDLSLSPNLTEVVMEVLYGIMEHNENFKWLIDPANQARVAKLVEYRIRQNLLGDVPNQAHENELLEKELRIKVDELIHENLRIKTENVRLMGKDSQSKAVDKNVEELERRLQTTEEALSMQKEYRRQAEAAFQEELESKSDRLCSLQCDLDEKNAQLISLLAHGAESSAANDWKLPDSNSFKDLVLEKDREICRLNLELSTKQTLVDEIAKRVVHEFESTHAMASNGTVAAFDMDMFLFTSVARKQARVEALEAAVASMEREVRSLEARVAKKSRDSVVLKTKLKSMVARLTAANVHLSRVQSENDRLVASLKDKQGKMHDLIEFLETKEKQVMYLEEQVTLRETQLERVMAQYETTKYHPSDKMYLVPSKARC